MVQTVLMIEDDARLAGMVAAYLAPHGFALRHAMTAQEGIALLQREQDVKLVLLDLMLPDADGLDVCRQLRSLAAPLRAVPVVMLTAKGDPFDRVVGLEIGADDYLPKPFEPRELLARLRGEGMPDREAMRCEISGDHAGQPLVVFDHQDMMEHHGIIPQCMGIPSRLAHWSRCSGVSSSAASPTALAIRRLMKSTRCICAARHCSSAARSIAGASNKACARACSRRNCSWTGRRSATAALAIAASRAFPSSPAPSAHCSAILSICACRASGPIAIGP